MHHLKKICSLQNIPFFEVLHHEHVEKAQSGFDIGQGYTGPKTGDQGQGAKPWTHKKIVLQGQGFKPWTHKKDYVQGQGFEPWTDQKDRSYDRAPDR